MALPSANYHSHHFNLHIHPYSLDGVINGHQPNKNNLFYVFYAFDTESIQEVDNFQINIDVFTNQTECLNTIQQDLLPISLLIPKYIQNVLNHKVLIALFDNGGTITLFHERVLMTRETPFISTNQIFTTLAGEFQSKKKSCYRTLYFQSLNVRHIFKAMHAKYSLVHTLMILFSDEISYRKYIFMSILTITQ